MSKRKTGRLWKRLTEKQTDLEKLQEEFDNSLLNSVDLSGMDSNKDLSIAVAKERRVSTQKKRMRRRSQSGFGK
ncbi:hypothetical protein BOX15_Mlig007511g1 [Macrostomum lignano]|uniref:Uncharacterized protein n=1 Tax=Macrostomum lignano TaxID=282301 RepID=A0A267FLY5_9PLAT|nr:hypothetical protein BOX15_Mlig007511g1 [Macrostomum lignano]